MNATSHSAFMGELFVPAYGPARIGEWELLISPVNFAPGYWGETKLVHGMAALVRGEDTWMSLSPMEMESQEIGIRLARGHVVIAGFGMGWAALACAALDAVERVTIVERDPAVIALHAGLDLAAQLPGAAEGKLHVVEADALEYVPERPADLLMPDIWLPVLSDARIEQCRTMVENTRAGSLYFWGQELELARIAVAAGLPLDDAGLRAAALQTGLPLTGLDWPGYPRLVEAAARRWMRGRWLPGSNPPW